LIETLLLEWSKVIMILAHKNNFFMSIRSKINFGGHIVNNK
jgi:hypothetical protein